MPKQLVYVHGAGRQKPAPALKHDIDMVLFGKDMPTSRIGYYANVRWPSAATPAGPAVTAIGAASKTRRTSAIRATLDPNLSANDAANEIVDATLRGPGGGAVAAAVAGTTPAEIAQAKRLVAQLYRRADKIAARSAAPAPAAGLGFGPDVPGPDVPVGRRQVRERRHRLPVRAVQARDAGAGDRRHQGDATTQGRPRPQPRHDHRVRRPSRPVDDRAQRRQG